VFVTASPNDYIYDHGSASTTITLEPETFHFTLHISYEAYVKEEAKKEIERLRDCKMRNKLKRVGLFTKKGLY